jgi:ribose transport system substrate-binding protein
MHQGIDSTFIEEINSLKLRGLVGGYRLVDANQSASTQITQIADLILQHVSVIVIDPTSPTALTGVIAQADAAGIPVLVVNDGPVTSDIPYELGTDAVGFGYSEAKWLADNLKGQGNVLEIRGIAGNTSDQLNHDGIAKAFKEYPGIKVVAQVYGDWTESVTQANVAKVVSGLPQIDGIITQGQEAYGAIQAFLAAGRKVPVTVLGNTGVELQWWNQEYQKNGYSTYSVGWNPAMGTAAAYVAVKLAHGATVPKNMMSFPVLEIDQNSLPQYLNVPPNGMATKVPTEAWIDENLLR